MSENMHTDLDQNDNIDELQDGDIEQSRFIKKSLSVETLYKRYKSFKLNFDLAIQRKENIWDNKKQSLLIHSLLSDMFIPAIVAIKDDNKFNIIDGKQRLTTIFNFIGNEFTLDKTTPKLNGIVIAGHSFKELPENFQKIIKGYKFDVAIGENLTDEDIEVNFYRLNNGVPLNTIELTRVLLGNKIISFLQRITNHPFFEYKINMSGSAKKRYTDQELVLQILKLIYYPDTGLSSKEMKPFVQQLRDEDLKEELKSSLDNALYYLNEAFPKKQKFLKKIHVPMLVLVALDVIHNNLNGKITSFKFGDWADEFFSKMPQEYKHACQSGSAKKESVQTRIRVMKEHFYNYFEYTIDPGKQKNVDDMMDIV